MTGLKEEKTLMQFIFMKGCIVALKTDFKVHQTFVKVLEV